MAGHEQAVVRKMSAHLGLDDDVVTAMEEHYRADRALRQKRLDLIFPDGRPF